MCSSDLVVGSASFASADLDTALIERERAALFEAPPLAVEVAAAGVVAHELAGESALEDADPWSRRDGWRLHGGATRRFDIEIGGLHHTVRLERSHDGAARLAVADGDAVPGHGGPFEARRLDASRHDVRLGERRFPLAVYAVGETRAVFAPEGSALVHEHDAIAQAGAGAGDAGSLTAPMPGKVIALLARPGDAVAKGQALAVMEAMKMEHTITAPHDGIVAELLYAVGDQVDEGGELLRLAAAAK